MSAHNILVEGVRLEAHLLPGTRAGPTLVFLHEGLGSVSLWKDFPARVSEATGLPALVYSRQGYGRSDPIALPRPIDFMHREAAVLERLLDHAGIDEAIVVGHSDGASIALIHAGQYQDGRVRGLVLEAPHVFVEDVTVASIAAATDAFRNTSLRERLAVHHDDVEGAFWGWNRVWLDPAFRTWDIRSYLPRIEVPLLVIQGEDDAYGTLAQVHALADAVRAPVDVRVLPHCGHSPHRDQPVVVLDAIRSFVQRLLE